MEFTQVPFRSISLPSRLNPIHRRKFESESKKIRSCFSKAAPVTSEAIQSGLLGLVGLYNSIEEPTHFQATRQALIGRHQLMESISGSIELLDSCNTIKELVQMIKEHVRSLQSALRRNGMENSSIQHDVAKYFSRRKKMKKNIAMTLKTLKNLEKENVDGSFVSATEEVIGINVAIFKCLLMFLSHWPMAKHGCWNLVAKLMVAKSTGSSRDFNMISEVGGVDIALNSLQGRAGNGGSRVLDVELMQRLKDLDSCLEGIEAGLERLFRQLVRSRVTLLNILTDQ